MTNALLSIILAGGFLSVVATMILTNISTGLKLEVIRVDVNSNLSLVKRQLAAALIILNKDREDRGLEPITTDQLGVIKEGN